MPSFTQRSYRKELLDRDDIPFEDIRRNMQELDTINHRLGGHAITMAGLKKLLARNASRQPLHIAEIGCGGGDNLRVIRDWAVAKQVPVQLTGIDINPHCIAHARSQKRNKGLDFVCADYRDAVFTAAPDIVFSSLFCHHFTDEALVEMLQWMKRNSRMGFFINDLHRHPLAYYSIRLLTSLFSRSYLVKHDAPLSVLRGFRRREWQALLRQAGIENGSCSWKWAFRWLVVYEHGVIHPDGTGNPSSNP